LNVDQYEQLVETGVLDGQAIELINGLLVRKMRKKPPHVVASEATRDELLPLIQPGWRLTIEAPVRIPDFDEPEPDLGVVRGTRNDYKNRHPGPADLALLIEVSDTTLDQDRRELSQRSCRKPPVRPFTMQEEGGSTHQFANNPGTLRSSSPMAAGLKPIAWYFTLPAGLSLSKDTSVFTPMTLPFS
jgi:hypothetical protein